LRTVVARLCVDLARLCVDLDLPRARFAVVRLRVEALLRFELLLAEDPLRLVSPPVGRDPPDPLLRDRAEPDAVLA
jgi:hypothetical protein